MKDNKAPTPVGDNEFPEANDKDFQLVLKELLAAYQPVFEEELKRAKSPESLGDEAFAARSCEEEIRLANRIFEPFTSEKVALSYLPAEARKLLGEPARWRWCLLHIRCCLVFGWLVCRGPRTFRSWAYYLNLYWRCVRQVLDTPVSDPPTAAEREDFQILVKSLAEAFKPYLTDQLATVEFPAGIPEEVFTGKIDCLTDAEEVCIIFERLINTETARALLGAAAFERHSKEPFFWFCRCWCLCALCLGCCLARARNVFEIRRCLAYYFRCLRNCFRPLTCDLKAPTGCAEELPLPIPTNPPGAVGLEIDGTAAGGFFSHYKLEWRQAQGQACDDNTGFSSTGIYYPGGGASGTVQVNSGALGWLDTTLLKPGSYEIRLCVYSSTANTPACCTCIQFALFKKMVWIDRVADLPGAPVKTPPGWFDQAVPPQSPIVSGNPGGIIVPVGGSVSVIGSAVVGECQNRKIACVDLRAAIGWQPGTAEPGFAASIPLYSIPMLASPICYTDPDPTIEAKKRASWNQLYERPLTAIWTPTNIPPFGIQYCLPRNAFNSAGLLPPCPDTQHSCQSGKYTLLLDVTDTMGNHYYDTQQVWFDNKPIHVEFDGLQGVAGCQDVCLSKLVPPGFPCNTCWPINLLGIVQDELIDALDNTYPSNNFDFYSLYITRQGGPTYNVPITPDCSTLGPNPLQGTQMVGEWGTRCEEALGCPAPAHGGKFANALTTLDLRVFDAVCSDPTAMPPNLTAPFAPPPGFALDRGTCCGYTFQLYAQDKTWSDGWAGGLHHAWSLPWALTICNDLDPNKPVKQCS